MNIKDSKHAILMPGLVILMCGCEMSLELGVWSLE
jgi:hypothetical protein